MFAWKMQQKRTGTYLRFCYALFVGIAFVTNVIAEDLQSKGSLKYQYDQLLYRSSDIAALNGGRAQSFHSGNFRYNIENHSGNWLFEANYALRYEFSVDKTFEDGTQSGVDYPPDYDRTKLFGLSRWLFSDTSQRARHALDRLYFGYTADSWSLKFGRQAISWGNGFNFHPMDLFNPFSPNAIDKEYKNGDDLFYGQWLFQDGSDAQFILVPRREYRAEKLSGARSSVALKMHRQMWVGDLDMLVARHFDENVFGLGWSKSVLNALVRGDATISRDRNGELAAAGILNADYSWTLFNTNMYGYLEYYYQSLGVKKVTDVASARLLDRVTRSEVFVVGEHYLSGGLMIELGALVHLTPGVIINLADQSFVFPLRLSYEWKQNWSINTGVNFAYGRRSTEFGGVAIPQTEYYQAAGQSAFLLVARYF